MHGTFPVIRTLKILDQTGHTKIEWTAEDENSVSVARAAFNDARTRGLHAFKIGRDGERGERVTSFDPQAEEYILAPQLVGG